MRVSGFRVAGVVMQGFRVVYLRGVWGRQVRVEADLGQAVRRFCGVKRFRV